MCLSNLSVPSLKILWRMRVLAGVQSMDLIWMWCPLCNFPFWYGKFACSLWIRLLGTKSLTQSLGLRCNSLRQIGRCTSFYTLQIADIWNGGFCSKQHGSFQVLSRCWERAIKTILATYPEIFFCYNASIIPELLQCYNCCWDHQFRMHWNTTFVIVYSRSNIARDNIQLLSYNATKAIFSLNCKSVITDLQTSSPTCTLLECRCSKWVVHSWYR